MHGLFALMLVLLIVVENSPIVTFAANKEKTYTFIYSNGETVDYYIDDNGYEYIYENGKKVYILLPLEKYLITDENVLEDEMNRISASDNAMDAENDCSENLRHAIVATLFNSQITFGNSIYRIGYNPWAGNADHIRLQTSNHKPVLSNHKLHVIFYWKLIGDNHVYSITYMNQNCSTTQGYSLSTGIETVDVGVTPAGGMTSCKLQVTLTVG